MTKGTAKSRKPARKSAGKSTTKSASKSVSKSLLRGKTWKRSIKIDTDKYEVISKAILASLTSKPIQFEQLAAKVKSKVKDFPGSVSWYTVSTLRELETQKKVIRTVGKVTTYQKG